MNYTSLEKLYGTRLHLGTIQLEKIPLSSREGAENYANLLKQEEEIIPTPPPEEIPVEENTEGLTPPSDPDPAETSGTPSVGGEEDPVEGEIEEEETDVKDEGEEEDEDTEDETPEDEEDE